MLSRSPLKRKKSVIYSAFLLWMSDRSLHTPSSLEPAAMVVYVSHTFCRALRHCRAPPSLLAPLAQSWCPNKRAQGCGKEGAVEVGDADKHAGIFGRLGVFHELEEPPELCSRGKGVGGSGSWLCLECRLVSQGVRSTHLKIPQAACQSILGLFNCTESLLPCLLVRVESWLQ